MPFPSRLLNEGERVVVSTRTHPKALLGPLLVLLVTALAVALLAGVAVRELDEPLQTVAGAVVGALAAAAVAWWVVRPAVRWATTTYTFTDRRFISRAGVVAKEGRTIPLDRISGVDYEIGVVDRVFGCGTLVVSDASEQGRVELRDIPSVEQVQLLVAEELHRRSTRSHDGT